MKSILEEYNKVQKEHSKASKIYNKTSKALHEVSNKIEKYIIENKLYIPIEELTKFKDTDLSKIILIQDTGDTRDFWCDELMGIDTDGHFYYSSFNGGVFEYNKATDNYTGHYCGHPTNYNIVGFINIKFSSWDDLTKEQLEIVLIDVANEPSDNPCKALNKKAKK